VRLSVCLSVCFSLSSLSLSLSLCLLLLISFLLFVSQISQLTFIFIHRIIISNTPISFPPSIRSHITRGLSVCPFDLSLSGTQALLCGSSHYTRYFALRVAPCAGLPHSFAITPGLSSCLDLAPGLFPFLTSVGLSACFLRFFSDTCNKVFYLSAWLRGS
ncbi:unnamed protein product, partial [Ectocarpus sp. 12 AP-2014]